MEKAGTRKYLIVICRIAVYNKKYLKKGEEMMTKWIMLLNEDGRLSDIIRVSQDDEYRQKLYVEYHII